MRTKYAINNDGPLEFAPFSFFSMIIPAALACPNCTKELKVGAPICPWCGRPVVNASQATAIDIYVESRVKHELEERLTDETVLVRELADKTETATKSRLRMLGIYLASIVTLLGAFGYSKINDGVGKAVNNLEERAAMATQKADDVSGKVDLIAKQIKALDTSLEGQKEKLRAKQAEIDRQLASASDSQKSMSAAAGKMTAATEEINKTADQLRARVSSAKQDLNTSLRQIQQVERTIIQAADSHEFDIKYPIPREPEIHLRFGGQEPKLSSRQPGEKWVGFSYIGKSDHLPSRDAAKKAIDKLRESGYKPLVGRVDFMGFWGRDDATLRGRDGEPFTVYYFRDESKGGAEKIARDLAAAIGASHTPPLSKWDKRSTGNPQALDPPRLQQYLNALERLLLESGVDFFVAFQGGPIR